MKKENRINQVEKMIKESLQSLFVNQNELTFDKFAITTLEALMLLEREEYLKSSTGLNDSGNGSYARDFKSLRLNSLKINIPRARNITNRIGSNGLPQRKISLSEAAF